MLLRVNCRHECAILDAVYRAGLGKFGHLALRAILVKDLDFFTSFVHTAQQRQLVSVCGERLFLAS